MGTTEPCDRNREENNPGISNRQWQLWATALFLLKSPTMLEQIGYQPPKARRAGTSLSLQTLPVSLCWAEARWSQLLDSSRSDEISFPTQPTARPRRHCCSTAEGRCCSVAVLNWLCCSEKSLEITWKWISSALGETERDYKNVEGT